jgi:tRNA (guanine37-N1)-methyltransferase
MKYSIVTLFPESIQPYLDSSILGRAQRDKKITISYYNPRDYTRDPRRRVDQRPYGGGPGMVLEAEPLLRAIEKARGKKKQKTLVVFFVPSGKVFTQTEAKKYTAYQHIIFICGRYEGIDERVAKITRAKKISVGEFVLTGGELPAALMIDAISRNIPGILGSEDSREDERISSPAVYTRPEVLTWKKKNYRVPKVLIGGNHKKIDEWREAESLKMQK